MEYVCECKMDMKSACMDSFLHGIEWIMFHGHLESFHNPTLGGRLNTKLHGDHGTLNAHNRSFILFYHV